MTCRVGANGLRWWEREQFWEEAFSLRLLSVLANGFVASDRASAHMSVFFCVWCLVAFGCNVVEVYQAKASRLFISIRWL